MALKDRIQCGLCRHWFKSLGGHLRVHEVTTAQYKRRFGVRKVVSEQLRALGGLILVRRGWGKSVWPERRIQDTIRRIARRGDSLLGEAICRRNASLYDAAERQYGTWSRAVREAGLDYAQMRASALRGRRSAAKNRVCAGIRARQQAGEPLDAKTVERTDRRLYHGATIYHGNWGSALRAAGLDPDAVRLKPTAPIWSREKILAEIARWNTAERPVSPSLILRKNPALYAITKVYFGNWRKALAALGLDYLKHFEWARNRWTPERVTAEIRSEHRAGRSLDRAAVCRRYYGLFSAANRVSGGWRAALAAAGLNPDEHMRLRPRSRDQILTAIRDRVRRGATLATNATAAEDAGLVRAGAKYFGAWRAAIRAAGFTYPDVRKKADAWTRDRVVQAIRRDNAAGRSLRPQEVKRRAKPLFNAAYRWFSGGWRAALLAAGIDPERLMKRVWSRERVSAAIRRRVQLGKSLGYDAVQAEDSGLVTTAARLFGSWREAVRTSGYTVPTPARNRTRSWTRDSVVQAILVEERAGRSLRLTDIAARRPDLRNAVHRCFPGGWRAALAAAGLDPAAILGRSWTRDRFAAALRTRMREGESIKREVVLREDSGLIWAAKRIARTWREALRTVGIEPEE
ncbi:MAG: hypothetical protein HYZ53_19815 [Planctomycetes bacterium]|nr:hypothetical protein [Planctomycetota bacterium]